jgi:hypothetical protein
MQVMGALLRGKEKIIWEESLTKLCMAGALAADGENIFDQLRISFDNLLDPNHKNIFVDVACVFIHERAAVAKSVWQG